MARMRRRTSPAPALDRLLTESNDDGADSVDDLNDDDSAPELGDAAELDDPRFQGCRWNVYRVLEGARGFGAFVTRLTGPLDLQKLKELLGGGAYKIVGTLNRRRFVHDVTIDGPALSLPNLGAPMSSPAMGVPVPDSMALLLEEIRALRAVVAQQPAVDPMRIFLAALETARTLVPQQQGPQVQLVEPLLSMYERGYKQAQREDSGEGQGLGTLLREISPIVQTLVEKISPAPAAVRTTVANRPATSPMPIDPHAANNRVIMLAEMLARAVRRRQPVDELCDVAESTLSDVELASLVNATPDQLLASIPAAVRVQYDVLEDPIQPDTLAYVRAFLEELRRPPDDVSTGPQA